MKCANRLWLGAACAGGGTLALSWIALVVGTAWLLLRDTDSPESGLGPRGASPGLEGRPCPWWPRRDAGTCGRRKCVNA